MQQHIPAWKRIGLKLKYAKDPSHQDYHSPESEITGTSNGNHEIPETANLDHARPLKKRRLSPSSTAQRQTEVSRPLETRSPTRNAVNKCIVAAHNEETNAELPAR
jgi:hypothetical protein